MSGATPESATTVLLASAWSARWRAPEMSVALARHAESQAGAPESRVAARAVAVGAGFRLGGGTVDLPDAVSAMRAVEAAGATRYGDVTAAELTCALRIDLAGRASAVGLPRAAFTALEPVLLTAPAGSSAELPAPHAMRAAALVRSVRCLSAYGPRNELDEALSMADRLYASETALDTATVTALRALVHAVTAAWCRRRSDPSAAVSAAADGLRLLDGGADRAADGVYARTRLILELVSALLDRGDVAAASRFADPVLGSPPRAPDAAAAGWLRFVVAVRLHWRCGELRQAQRMLREASATARHYRLDGLLTESQSSLAELCDLTGDAAEAAECARSARDAANTRAERRRSARSVLAAEFPPAVNEPDEMFARLGDALAGFTPAAGEAEPAEAPAEPAELPAEPAEPPAEPAAAGGSRRHGPGARQLAVSQVPGVVVAEGTGGRRRAPDPGGDQTVLAAPAERVPDGAAPADPAGAEPDEAVPRGKHGAPGIGPRVATARARSSGRSVALREARHAAASGEVPPSGEPPVAEAEAGDTARLTPPAPRSPEQSSPGPSDDFSAASRPEEPAAGQRDDLGLGDLLTEALAAFRGGEAPDEGSGGEPDSGRHAVHATAVDTASVDTETMDAAAATAEADPAVDDGQRGSGSAGAHASGQRPGIQWQLSGGAVSPERRRSSG